ncbi:lymphocyte antigen 6S-like [Phyllopteryx taeniolatus]|uniref:lymphocyte antigen 6S-like n=1 Tax=Phyllopteryx taeniolatus TaxID=161469 RepID=UPI002AD3E6D4|nr:lymphocyte antigen 6S-like [Phyllopteryx taeniolatus]
MQEHKKKQTSARMMVTMELILVMTLFTVRTPVLGLRCYTCSTNTVKEACNVTTCSLGTDYCFSMHVSGEVLKGCMNMSCSPKASCCVGNLCNGASPAAPHLLILAMSSALSGCLGLVA